MCCGIFVQTDQLDSMIKAQEERLTASAGEGKPKQAVLADAAVSYIKCPVCLEVMNRVNYGRISGVIVDVCSDHGYWLDAGELEKIAAWVSSGGLAKKYELEVEELKAEKRRIRDSMMSDRSYTGAQPAFGGELERHFARDGGGGFFELLTRLFDF